MSLVWWLVVVGAFGAAVVGVFAVLGLSGVDRGQQERLIQWLAEGRFGTALAGSGQTSGPGPGVMTPAYLVARPFLSVGASYAVASVVCLVPLVVATVAATRAFGIIRRSPRELLALILVVGGVPTMANYLEVFHPADVLATAAVLGAYAAVLRGRAPLAALLLGFGLATKQWVIVAVAVLAILETGRDRVVLAVGSMAVFAVLLAPFAILDFWLTLGVMSAKDTSSTPLVVPGLLDLESTPAFLLSRYLPLAAVFVLCWWLRDRQARATPVVAITALGVAFGLRAAVDTAGYGYYAAPGYAALVIALVGIVRPQHVAAVAAAVVAGCGLLWLRLSVYDWPLYQFEASMGRTVLDGWSQSSSVPWAIVESLLLVAIPAICMVLLERATRPRADDEEPTAGVGVPEQADPGETLATSG